MAEKGKYEPREKKMLLEWMAENYASFPQWRRPRVGPSVPGAEGPMYEVLKRYPDAVIVHRDEILIVEASVRPMPEKIYKLDLYKKLFPDTPMFSAYRAYPIRLIYLTGFLDEAVRDQCVEHGVEYEVFAPAWLKEYFKTLISK